MIVDRKIDFLSGKLSYYSDGGTFSQYTLYVGEKDFDEFIRDGGFVGKNVTIKVTINLER